LPEGVIVSHKIVEVGCLNIKLHPHAPEKYLELFTDIFSRKHRAKIFGDKWGTPHLLMNIDSAEPLKGLYGSFFQYTQIDPNKPWLDLTKMQAILDDNGDPVQLVDKDKMPNLSEIEFVFYPVGHRLFFNAKKVTPLNIQKMLETICGDGYIYKKFGRVLVDIEWEKEVINKILSIPTITKLEITISRPNPDDIADLEDEVISRMDRQKINRWKEILDGTRNEGIQPDAVTIGMMNIASSNGKVTARGYDVQGSPVEESTDPYPFKDRTTYNPNTSNFFNTMIDFTSRLLPQIRRKATNATPTEIT